MYGYGFSRPWQDVYEPPRLDCGQKDLDKALEEYSFLDNPTPDINKSILLFYTTELNHAIKRNLYCIVSFDYVLSLCLFKIFLREYFLNESFSC